MFENIQKGYILLFGLFFCFSLLILLSGAVGTISNIVLLVFAALVIVGGCYLIGMLIADAAIARDGMILLVLLLVGIILLVVWVAGLGFIEVFAALFLLQIPEVAMKVFLAVMIVISTGIYLLSN